MDADSTKFRHILEKGIGRFFFDAVKVGLNNPRFFIPALNILRNQMRAARIRVRRDREGTHIPPFMIMSITRQCNLSCKGCYSKVLHRDHGEEVSSGRIRSLIAEAEELGIATVLLAGGEPLLRHDILEIAASFPRMLFPVFTNGTLFDERFLTLCKARRNLIPVISIEGGQANTDARRGDGVFAKAAESIGKLRAAGIFCGISLTVTSRNISAVATPEFIEQLCRRGCRLFFFVEFVPVESGSEELVLNDEERRTLSAAVARCRAAFDALFIAFPGDEEQFGGCLAAGRGFIHVNPWGDLEACPLAPFSDVNVRSTGLREGLGSPLLRKIRENHHLLEETAGGCALWDKREEVNALIKR